MTSLSMAAMRRGTMPALVVLLGLCGGTGAAGAEDLARTDPTAAKWTVNPGLDDKDESKNLSGVACAARDGTKRSCLMIGDEKRYARFFTIDGSTIQPGAKITLLPEKDADGNEYGETDVEGIDYEEPFYYLVGSHGLPKKAKLPKDVQSSRYFIYRFPVDAAGKPAFKTDGMDPAPEVVRRDDLRRLFAQTPPLDRYAGKLLQNHGVNIEGMAVRGDQLYLGFRGPSIDGMAYILRTSVKSVFEGGQATEPKMFEIRLGEGMGIRDLTKVTGGFLVLTGPEADVNGKAEVFFWNGDGTEVKGLKKIKEVAGDDKPEALLLLEERTDGYLVLVLHDGPANGKPAEYFLKR